MEIPVQTIRSFSREKEKGWQLNNRDIWHHIHGDNELHGDAQHDGDSEHEHVDLEMLGFGELELDIRDFDGDEPEIAEIGLAVEGSDIMNLDTGQSAIIGGVEEDDLLHYEGAAGVEHKSAEDSVGMYLHEIGRV